MDKRFIICFIGIILSLLLILCVYTIWLPHDKYLNTYHEAKLRITSANYVNITSCHVVSLCKINYTSDQCINSNGLYCSYGACYNIYVCKNELFETLDSGYCRSNDAHDTNNTNVICKFQVTRKYNYTYYNDKSEITIRCVLDCPKSTFSLYYNNDNPTKFVANLPSSNLSPCLVAAMVISLINIVVLLMVIPIYFSFDYKTNNNQFKIEICGIPYNIRCGWFGYLSMIGVWLIGLFGGAIIYWNDLSLILTMGIICFMLVIISVVVTAGCVAITSYVSIYSHDKHDVLGIPIVLFPMVFSIVIGIPLLTVYLSDPKKYWDQRYMFIDGIYFIVCAGIFLLSQIIGMWIGIIHAKKTYKRNVMSIESNSTELEIINNENN